MPKIAIDVRKWRDYGIGTYVRNLVRHLAHLDRETTYFLFCDPADEATLRDLAENFVPVVDSSRGYRLQEHISIPLKLRRLGVDLLHSPHYVLPLLCRRRAVVTIHDCIHLLFPEYLPNRMALTYAQRMMGHAIEHSSLVFTVSEASRRDILRFYPGADPERVQVVPNAIDAALLEHPGEEEMERVEERYQIRGRFVLYAGNIKPHKNLERLIHAFGLLKQRPGYDDLKLLIIGDEINKYGSLRRRVEAAGVRHDVRFFGFVPDSTLSALYRMAAVFAFPSLYEGFGLPPLEAMASGTPGVRVEGIGSPAPCGWESGCVAVSRWYITAQSAKRSSAGLGPPSGASYEGVRPATRASRARPRSASLITPEATMMFEGRIDPWTRPFWCSSDSTCAITRPSE
jgi:glycosyltransferase involved in cell wall biosynthesis